MFETEQELSVLELIERLEVSRADIVACLLKLCSPSALILSKENPRRPTFEDNEKIKLNQKFTNKSIMLNLRPVETAKEAAKDDKAGEKVDGDTLRERANVIDAVCVRIMKTEKTLKLTILISRVID